MIEKPKSNAFIWVTIGTILYWLYNGYIDYTSIYAHGSELNTSNWISFGVVWSLAMVISGVRRRTMTLMLLSAAMLTLLRSVMLAVMPVYNVFNPEWIISMRYELLYQLYAQRFTWICIVQIIVIRQIAAWLVHWVRRNGAPHTSS